MEKHGKLWKHIEKLWKKMEKLWKNIEQLWKKKKYGKNC